MTTLSIIIPVYNEEKTILEILKRVDEEKIRGIKKQIIVVNDGSTDKTGQFLKKSKVKFELITHNKNTGKGTAIKTALTRANGEITLIQDADLEYNPTQYTILLDTYFREKVRAVYGSRNLIVRTRGYFHFYWGGKVLTWLINILFNGTLTDINTGYKLIDTKLLKSLKLESNRFNFCEEVTIKLLKKGIRIIEVPINYNPRKFCEGKKLSILDGLIGFWTIIKYYR